MSRWLVLAVAALGMAGVAAADDLKTLMTERGKLLLRDHFGTGIDKGWKKAKGKWDLQGDYLRAAQVKEDMHGAVMRYTMPLGNVVFQYDFKFDGAAKTTLSLNATKGHLSRVLVSPTSLTVKKDSLDHGLTDKAAVLEQRTIALKPGTWHTLLVELSGKEILASIDGKDLAYGKHDGIDRPKGNFGLTVAGETMAFKNFRAWEAQPNPAWELNRQKLLDARGK